MWNTLASVCVGQTEPGEKEEKLGQTWSEPHLKQSRKCVRPVRNQFEGLEGPCSQSDGSVDTERVGSGEVCQLHNDAPPWWQRKAASTVQQQCAAGQELCSMDAAKTWKISWNVYRNPSGFCCWRGHKTHIKKKKHYSCTNNKQVFSKNKVPSL